MALNASMTYWPLRSLKKLMFASGVARMRIGNPFGWTSLKIASMQI